MHSKLLFCLALVLSGGFICCCNLVRAGENVITSSSSAPPAGQVYHDTKYGFQLVLPQGWEARETNLSVAHYDYVFLTINNQRPGLAYEGWDGRWMTNDRITQLQPDEVYISVGYAGGPMGVSMMADNVGEDLSSFLATNQVRVFSSNGMLNYSLSFFKRGQHWSVWACLKEPVTENNRQKVMALLQSIRFVPAPVGNASWAESLAWSELPEKIRDTGDWWQNWPTVNLYAEESGSERRGQRSVSVTNLGLAYSVKFTLEAIGEWSFMVKTNGEVESAPPLVHAVGPPPSQWPSDLPGASRGMIDSYWVAPYVQAAVVSGRTTLNWFSKDGNIEHQIATSDVQPGFVDILGRPRTIQGINEDWQITLPRGSSDMKLAGYITSTADSRVFVHERHPKLGQIALDIYVHGKRINTIGPFWQDSVSDVVLNDDGSAAFLIAGTNMRSDVPLSGDALREKLLSDERVHAQIVVLNTNGRIRFKTECGPGVRSPIVAPNGAGVLLRPSTGTNQNTFMWFTATGLQRSLKISPNPEFLGWIPGTCQALFSTSIGSQSGPYALIDWNTGQKVWDIPGPGDGEFLGIALTPKFILFSVAEPYPSGTSHKVNESLLQSGKKWVRTFYAVEVQDGKMVARWRGQFPHGNADKIRDHFLQLGDRFYYVTADEFTELNLNDIIAKAHGWQ
jgi:hypothetical protein